MSHFKSLMFLAAALCSMGTIVHGARIVAVDTDGSSAGTALTLNPKVTFGNGMTGGYTVSVPATAVGLPAGNSIAGGNAPAADQYIFSYTVGTDADNASITAGTALGNGNTATGLAAGASGLYNVFVCWPNTSNISDNGAVPTSYSATNDAAPLVVGVNQDEDTNGAGVLGGVWVKLGSVNLTAGTTYTVTQTAPNSSFVSMRAVAAMWEPAPEPGSLSLLSIAGLGFLRRRKH